MENNDLISRSELHRMLSSWDWQDLYLPIHFSDLIAEQKAVDAAPVVHGRWAWGELCGQKGIYCSHCGAGFSDSDYVEEIAYAHDYCQKCGARIDLEDDVK